MSLSVVIPAVNEADRIASAVGSSLAFGASESLVVDGGSSDRTASLAAAAGARVLTSPAGRAIQMNHGFANSSGAVVLFLHADSRLPENGRQQLDQAVQNGAAWGCLSQRIEGRHWLFRPIESGNRMRARWLHRVFGDQALWATRSAFQSAGGFPDVPLMEDILISRALSRNSGSPAVLPCQVITSARRWQQRGILRQTLENWSLQIRFALGTSPHDLARHYRRHDRPPS